MSSLPSLKEILANPAQCIALRWPDADQADARRPRIATLLAALDELRPQLRAQKETKQLCARDFGRIKKEGGDLAAAKQRMQEISAALAQLETRQRELEAELLALFADAADNSAPFPLRFTACSRAHTGQLTILDVEDSDSAAVASWQQYVDAQPQASLYHDYRWRSVVQRSFGHETRYLAARDDTGEWRGVLPLVRLRSRLFGDFAVSMPYFNYGGVLADNAAASESLLRAAAEWAHAQQLQHIEIRATNRVNDWPARTDKVSMILRLPGDIEALDRAIGAKVRAQINRARQTSAAAKVGGIELLDDFYRVFAINMRDLGTPVYSKIFFANILTTFPQQARIVAIYLDSKAVATAFLLGSREMMEIPWASTLRTVNALNINMLLYHEVLKLCVEQGFAFFDFGRSSSDSGTFKFKKQWGAEPLQHYWHYWLRDGGDLPELKPDSPKFKLAIAAWQKIPVPITKLIGPHIVKFLP